LMIIDGADKNSCGFDANFTSTRSKGRSYRFSN
jgi:hypothetical protein